MSRIYFHSQFGTAEVSGRERAHFGVTCSDVALALLGVKFHDDPIQNLLPAGHYLRDKFDPRSFETWFSASGGAGLFLPDGRRAQSFDVALNTVAAIGNDVMRFMARVHGQCEIHGYIEGPNRGWFADLIEDGRRDKLLRAGMGWEAVVTLLRQRDDGPIVMSYSVCQAFPNATIAGWTDEQDGDGFYELSLDEQWTRALSGLRASNGGLELAPGRWSSFRFGDEITAMELREIANMPKSVAVD